jgi:hypothetical protein
LKTSFEDLLKEDTAGSYHHMHHAPRTTTQITQISF